MNFSIYQALIVIGITIWPTAFTVLASQHLMTQNVTEYDRSFQKVLSRRKRFLIYRPGSNVLLTASLVKPLGFRRPTGHNLIIEWDLFYPLITTWKQPEVTLKPRTTSTTTELPVEIVESWTEPKEVWQPEGGWTGDVIEQINTQNKNAAAAAAMGSRRRVDNNIEKRLWSEHNLFNSNPSPPTFPSSFSSSLKWDPMLYREKQRQQQPWQLSRNNFNFNQQLPSRQQQQPQHSSSALFSQNFMAVDNKQKFMMRGRSLEDDDNWKHSRAHRERRDLYERIQHASPTNTDFIRSCLLRTMCEAQHFLLPRGFSLLHDMLRMIFTIPIKDEMNDDYSDAMRASDQDCVERYRENCPMSFLAILFH